MLKWPWASVIALSIAIADPVLNARTVTLSSAPARKSATVPDTVIMASTGWERLVGAGIRWIGRGGRLAAAGHDDRQEGTGDGSHGGKLRGTPAPAPVCAFILQRTDTPVILSEAQSAERRTCFL